MKETSNYRKFLLLWSGELLSAIGGGLTSFGLGPATAARVFAVLGSLFVLVGFAQKHKSRRGCHSRS